MFNLILKTGKCERYILYFNTGNMMGATKGAGPRINRDYPKAVPLWCASHQLNRVIVQSCTERPIKNMIGMIDSVNMILYHHNSFLVE